MTKKKHIAKAYCKPAIVRIDFNFENLAETFGVNTSESGEQWTRKEEKGDEGFANSMWSDMDEEK